MRERYDLIVFDWDGTLMDSETKILRCFEAAFWDAGLERPGDAAVRNIIGLGMREAVSALAPQASAAQHQAVIEAYRDHFLHRDQTAMEFFPGVLDGLKELEARGFMLAVATGKARRGLDRLLNEWQLGQQFVATRCADEAFSKPHPRMLQDLLDMTGVTPERAIMVGDTSFDMEMARNANTDRLAVSYGAHTRDTLLSFEPEACLDSFDEVRSWLN